MVGYVLDEGLRHELNRTRWQNYWDRYVEEINNLIGLTARRLGISDLSDVECLRGLSVLLLGRQSGERLGDVERANLAKWVREGGTLIGFAVPGLDDVFGIESQDTLRQGSKRLASDTTAGPGRVVTDDYAIGGYFDLAAHTLTDGVHSPLVPEQKLVIVADLEIVKPAGALELGRLYDAEGADLGAPAITWNLYGRGRAGYFAFDVAKTVWLLHQGRPIRGPIEGDPYPRSWQLQVIGDNSQKVAYADEICLLIRNMVASAGQPFIYQAPPDQGRVPDALFYWGGDCGPAGPEMVAASDWMKSRGLPYHINIRAHLEPEGLLDRLMHVRSNGHEVSIYYEIDLRRGLLEELLLWQSDYAYEHYGFRPGSSVCGPCAWSGWSEPARWLVKAGNRADNSFIATNLPSSHPKMNDSYYGSGFGSFFPFFFYDDYRHGNERIDLIEQQITWYELGHHGSAGDRESRCPSDVHQAVDMALHYHHATNVFYHPVYIANYPLCRDAIDEILRYLDEKGALVTHMANDQAAEWWRARSRSALADVVRRSDRLVFTSSCHHPSGMIANVNLEAGRPVSVTCDGRPVAHEVRSEFGGNWLYIVLPAGRHSVEVAVAQP